MTNSDETNWDYETDLLVVGTGSAGMAAAVVGSAEGLDVLVIEKTDKYGGTTALSGGVMWVPNNRVMKDAGIADTPEDALTYLKHNVGNRVAESKLKAFVEHAPKMADYMAANSELSFNLVHGFPDYRPETPGGHKGGRSIDPKVFSGRQLDDFEDLRQPAAMPGGIVGSVTEMRRLAFFKSNPKGLLQVWRLFPRNIWNRLAGRQHVSNGAALIGRLRLTLKQRGVPLWLEAPLEEFIIEEGAIVGARITKDGKAVNVRARKGVVVAAGGFERNLEMRKTFFGEDVTSQWADAKYTSGSPGSTGDAIRAGESVGAATDLMDDMWWMPSTSPPGSAPNIVVFERGLPHMMIVNSAGKRFANEARPYNELGRILFEEPAQPNYLIFDHTFRSKYALGAMPPGITPEKHIKSGFLKRAGAIEDLAGLAGIDPGGLADTVSRFNTMARAGRDDDFHKGESAFDLYAGDPAHQPNPCLGPIAQPPFYAMEILAGDLGTKGKSVV